MQKVLLAEDDKTMLSLLITLLKMEGYLVTSLLDEKGDLLENIQNEKPNFLILDIHLGDHNGIDLVRKIRQISDLNSLKVIMTSGMDMHEECLASGADDFLLKPYIPDDLLHKLRTLNQLG